MSTKATLVRLSRFRVHLRKGAMVRKARITARLTGKGLAHFLHIKKTGGTAIKYALSNAISERYVICPHRHHVRLRDVPPGDHVFFFLRDPIDRFVSGFYTRLREGRPRWDHPWSPEERIAFGYFRAPNQLAMGLSSGSEEERARAREAMAGIGHVNSHYRDWFESEEYFLSRLSDILFIGHQESLARDFERLKMLLAVPDAVSLPSDDMRSHRSSAGLDKSLEPEAVENLRAWYQEDFDFMDLFQSVSRKIECF